MKSASKPFSQNPWLRGIVRRYPKRSWNVLGNIAQLIESLHILQASQYDDISHDKKKNYRWVDAILHFKFWMLLKILLWCNTRHFAPSYTPFVCYYFLHYYTIWTNSGGSFHLICNPSFTGTLEDVRPPLGFIAMQCISTKSLLFAAASTSLIGEMKEFLLLTPAHCTHHRSQSSTELSTYYNQRSSSSFWQSARYLSGRRRQLLSQQNPRCF